MSLTYLLDTNILAEPLRLVPDPVVMEKLDMLASQVAVPSVVWHEMWFGCRRLPESARRSLIEKYLVEVIARTMPVLPYDSKAAEYHAAERARLTRMGKTPSFADGQIAAIARVNNLILVTFNSPDFSDFLDLTIESWREA